MTAAGAPGTSSPCRQIATRRMGEEKKKGRNRRIYSLLHLFVLVAILGSSSTTSVLLVSAQDAGAAQEQQQPDPAEQQQRVCADEGAFQARIDELERQDEDAKKDLHAEREARASAESTLESKLSVRECDAKVSEADKSARETCQAEVDRIEESRRSVEDDLVAAFEKLQRMEGDASSLAKQRGDLETKASDLEARLAAAERERDDLSEKLSSARKDAEESSRRVRDLEQSAEEQAGKHKRQIQELKDSKKEVSGKLKSTAGELESARATLFEVRRELSETNEKLREIENTGVQRLVAKFREGRAWCADKAGAALARCRSHYDGAKRHAAALYGKVEPVVSPVASAIAQACREAYRHGKALWLGSVWPRLVDAWAKARPVLVDAAEKTRAAAAKAWDSTAEIRGQIRERAAPVVDPAAETLSKLRANLEVRLEGPIRVISGYQQKVIEAFTSLSDVALTYCKLRLEQERQQKEPSTVPVFEYLTRFAQYVHSNSHDVVLYLEAVMLTWFVWYLYRSAVGSRKGGSTKQSGKDKADAGKKGHVTFKPTKGQQAKTTTNNKKKKINGKK